MSADLSLKGIVDKAILKEGYTTTPQNRHLRDLEDLINNMYDVRNDVADTRCSGHGNEVDTTFVSSASECSSHIGTIYNGKLSLGNLSDAFNSIIPCSCNVRTYQYCNCQVECIAQGNSCTCNARCDCNSRCSCQGNCSCNGNTPV